eukprot:4756468-Amphidinium_carterae.1
MQHCCEKKTISCCIQCRMIVAAMAGVCRGWLSPAFTVAGHEAELQASEDHSRELEAHARPRGKY